MTHRSHEKRWQPEAQTVTIRVPFDPALLSANKRYHWAKRARLTAEAKATAYVAWAAAGKPRLLGVVRVSIVVKRARLMDDDNVVSGIKALRDALFHGAIVKDDSPKWCEFSTPRQEIRKGPPEVVFTVTGDGRGPYSREVVDGKG